MTPGPNGGVNVTKVVAGGVYDQVGLQDGDDIRSVDSKAVNSFSDLLNASHLSVGEKQDGTKPIQVIVARGGNLYELRLDPKHGIEMKMVGVP